MFVRGMVSTIVHTYLHTQVHVHIVCTYVIKFDIQHRYGYQIRVWMANILSRGDIANKNDNNSSNNMEDTSWNEYAAVLCDALQCDAITPHNSTPLQST